MNLLEKALIVLDLKKNIQIVESHHLPLFERAKATHRLKEIFQFCEKPIIQKGTKGANQSRAPEDLCQDCVQKSLFQQSYRGLFFNQGRLLSALNGNPLYGWAFLFDSQQQKWQLWLIPQPNKGAIHSSWKNHPEDAYSWLTQQHALFHCLIEDQTIFMAPIDDAEPSKTISKQPRPQNTQKNRIVEPIIEPVQTPIAHIKTIQLEQYFAELQPLQLPKLLIPSFVVQFKHLEQFSELCIYLSVSEQADDFTQTPVMVIERLDQHTQFMGFIVIFGTIQPRAALEIAATYSESIQQKVGTIKSFSWQDWQHNANDLDSFFDLFLKKKLLWQPQDKYVYIPKQLLLTQRLIAFEEQQAETNTPLIVMKERLKYRVIHGESRLKYASNAQGYTCLLCSRQEGLSLQILQSIIDGLTQPIAVDTLYNAIQDYLAQTHT